MKQLCVRSRVIMSHDAFTSGTSRVLTVILLQRLKMEVLIPSPADCEVRCVIKFLNAQSIAPIEIHRQLCQVYGHTHLLQEFAWEVFNHHTPYSPDIAPSDFHIFLHLNKFLSGQRQRF